MDKTHKGESHKNADGLDSALTFLTKNFVDKVEVFELSQGLMGP